MRIFRLTYTFLRIAISNELQYRANFFMQILTSAISLIVGLVGLQLVYSQTTDLAGWTLQELLIVMGVYMVMGGVMGTYIQPNMLRLMEEIQDGSLDFALMKPVDGQVIISLREFHFWSLVDVVLGLTVIIVSLQQNKYQVNLGESLAFTALLFMGMIILYCFWLMLSASAFWFIRVGEIVELFQGIFAAGRWPIGIYPRWLRFFLTFIIPVAFAVTVPAEALTQRLTPETIIGTFSLTLFLLVLARVVWFLGVQHYSGASS
jgi:ABC-2 type transport system permease protein